MVYTAKYSNSHALVVGINKYRRVTPLKYAINDALGVADVLKRRFGFPDENVRVLLDDAATSSTVRQAFMAYANKGATAPDDRLVFFFAGHGHTVAGAGRQVGFLVPVDGSPADRNSLIRWDELTRDAELIEAKHVLFLMDACYGGLALQRNIGDRNPARYVRDMLQRPVRQVLTAGKADQPVSDFGPDGHSIFTSYLLEALEGAAATAEGVLTATGVMAWVSDRVANDGYSKQSPDSGRIDGDGDLVFNPSAVNSAAVHSPATVPPHRSDPPPVTTHSRRFATWIAVPAISALLLFVAVGVKLLTGTTSTDTAGKPTIPEPSKPSFRAQAVQLRIDIDEHIADFDEISRHEELNLFYGPVALQLVNDERNLWREKAEKIRSRIAECDAQPSTKCGAELIAGMSKPAPAPKPGFLVTYAANKYEPRQVFDLRKAYPFTVVRGDEGYSQPLAIAVTGQWTAHDGPDKTCDAIAGFLVFSTAPPKNRVTFKLTDRHLLSMPSVQMGSIDAYQRFLFGWPPAVPLEVALSREGSQYQRHAPCAPTPTLMVWQPDPRVFPLEERQDAVQLAARAAENLVSARPPAYTTPVQATATSTRTTPPSPRPSIHITNSRGVVQADLVVAMRKAVPAARRDHSIITGRLNRDCRPDREFPSLTACDESLDFEIQDIPSGDVIDGATLTAAGIGTEQVRERMINRIHQHFSGKDTP